MRCGSRVGRLSDDARSCLYEGRSNANAWGLAMGLARQFAPVCSFQFTFVVRHNLIRTASHEVVGPVAVDDAPCHHEAQPFPHHRIGRCRQPRIEHHVLDDACRLRETCRGAILILHIRHSFGVLRRILLSLCASMERLFMAANTRLLGRG